MYTTGGSGTREPVLLCRKLFMENQTLLWNTMSIGSHCGKFLKSSKWVLFFNRSIHWCALQWKQRGIKAWSICRMNESFVHILCFWNPLHSGFLLGEHCTDPVFGLGGGSGVWVIVWISMVCHGIPPVGAWTGSFHGWKSPRVPGCVVLPWCNVRDLVQMLHSNLLSYSVESHNTMCIHENTIAHTQGRFSCHDMPLFYIYPK